MKKNVIAIICAIMLSFVSTMAFAGAITSASAGASVALTDSGAGPGLTFTPSPSSFVSVFASDTAFTITSASAKTTTDNGIEYGILSSSNAMYQQVQAEDRTVTATQALQHYLPVLGKTKQGIQRLQQRSATN